MDKYELLTDNFFKRETLKTAKDLLGKVLVKNNGKKGILSGKIVETEAYIGEHDPACHAFQKTSGRSSVLYEEGGTIYVYFIYGNYYCFNVVTEKKGTGSAVLIRAVEPLEGIGQMKLNRPGIKSIHDLTNGPSKMCMAFGIGREFNNTRLSAKGIFISEPLGEEKLKIAVSKRIGIVKGAELPYRFFIKDNPYVTKHKFNKI
ncbi:MAG: DNA-3-methyladenine glycosylase [Ignavibacteriae bacterium]|nr:DNA-3-methyladenine glycosylase [Ignavibacteriota bacterium]